MSQATSVKSRRGPRPPSASAPASSSRVAPKSMRDPAHSCHGKTGEGSGLRQTPRVAGQNYAYLVRQIHDAVEGRRPNFSAAQHQSAWEGLDYADIMGVADYLARRPRRNDRMPPMELAAD